MHGQLDWEDLRYIMHVGRTGSLAGAARALRVNHSTMFRRIGAAEERLGVRLFERRREGYSPTAAGEAAIAVAARLDEEVTALERRLAGEDLRPSGAVRFTTTETLLPWVVPLCGEFKDAFPDICIELVTGAQMLDLSRRDADVALRPSSSPPDTLHGRRIGTIAFSIYGPHSTAHGPGEANWVGLDDSMSHLAAHGWIRANVNPTQVVLRASSLNAVLQAVLAGIGFGLLPCYMGDGQPRLRRVGAPVAGVATDLWLLVHEDLRRTARVKAFTDFMHSKLVARRAELEGSPGGRAGHP